MMANEPGEPVHRDRPTAAAQVRAAAATITEDFLRGRLDLSSRPGAPRPGWEALPEAVAAKQLRNAGASPSQLRLFITLTSAMDRARDAERLWRNSVELFRRHPWAFDSGEGLGRSEDELKDVLISTGVSQRHSLDVPGWRALLESVADEAAPRAVREAIFAGHGQVAALRDAVVVARPSGQPWFPFLRGPKVSVMWIRMLAWPGEATIEDLEELPVAVDVQVRKVTEYLGLTSTNGRPLESVRGQIQTTWQVAKDSAAGPTPISGTAAALDPALWFFAKWGCTHCEDKRRKMPIGRICDACRFHSAR